MSPSSSSFDTSYVLPTLLFVDGGQHRVISLQHTPFHIGRRNDQDLVISDSCVSREHASIVYEDNSYFVFDRASKHGTYVNGERVERQRLKPDDRIAFGALEAPYVVFDPALEATSSPAGDLLSRISEKPSGSAPDLEKLKLFLEVARKLNASSVLKDVLFTLVQSTLKLTNAERGYVFLRGPDDTLRLAVGCNSHGEVLPDDRSISRSIIEDAAKSGAEFLIADTWQSLDMAARNSIAANELRCVVCLPLHKLRIQDVAARTEYAPELPEVIGALYLDSRAVSSDFSGISHDILAAIAREAEALVENARLAQAEEASRRYQHELGIAASIQKRLMAVTMPRVSFASVRGRSIPSSEIGGDFFDVVQTEHGLAFALADVSGKGISAALLASTSQGMIYSQLAARVPICEIVASINQYLCRKELGGKYLTLVLGLLTPAGELEIVNCGHVPPLLVSNGKVSRLHQTNLPIGLLSDATFECFRLQLKCGDRLVMVTDGITEAVNDAGDFFEDERLETAARSDAPVDEILNSVQRFCSGTPVSDDCTVLEITCLAVCGD
jgi:serine phosphatase RsbU (regulator of sigma subunit)